MICEIEGIPGTDNSASTDITLAMFCGFGKNLFSDYSFQGSIILMGMDQ